MKKKGMPKVGGWEKGKGKEREPVIISFTTLFRPLLAHLRYSKISIKKTPSGPSQVSA